MRLMFLLLAALCVAVLSGCRPVASAQPAARVPAAPPATSAPAGKTEPEARPPAIAPKAAPAPVSVEPDPALAAARQAGWSSAELILTTLEQGDMQDFPGIDAWITQVRHSTEGVAVDKDPAEWPAFDIDQLVTRNADFWQAHYEIAPGDPGLHMLHAGLLLAAGEVNRANYLAVIALQRPGVPDEVRGGLGFLHQQAQKAQVASNAVVQEGIALYDAKDYAGALARHDAALAIWPQNGFAHYERGLTLYAQQLQADGEEVPPTASIRVNEGPTFSDEVKAAYAAARQHDPFQFRAWQGDDQEVIAGFMPLARQGMPAWKVVQNADKPAPDKTLVELAAALQAAGSHDLALVIRQILVARRGRYHPDDHPFITTSLQKLAPGETTDAVLKRLWDGELVARQIIAAPLEMKFEPDTVAPPANSAFSVKQLRLYVPVDQIQDRVVPDPQPLAEYVKALEKQAAQIVADFVTSQPALEAKGLLIAVGIKSPEKTRVWCEAVEGELPAELITQLETELAAIKACPLKRPPLAFGLEVGLLGESPAEFPRIPSAWQAEADRAGTRIVIPPDELFQTLWPD